MSELRAAARPVTRVRPLPNKPERSPQLTDSELRLARAYRLIRLIAARVRQEEDKQKVDPIAAAEANDSTRSDLDDKSGGLTAGENSVG